MKENTQFDIPQEEAYSLLFTMFSKKRRWKIKSFTEPSLIVVKTGRTGSFIVGRYASRPGGLARVMLEPKEERTEITFSFDFRIHIASFWVLELIFIGLLLGVFMPYLIPDPSTINLLFMIFLVFLALIAPWFEYGSIKEVKTGFIAASKEAIRKGMKKT